MYNVLIIPRVAPKMFGTIYLTRRQRFFYIRKHETFTINSTLYDARLGRWPAWYITHARSPTVQLGANTEKKCWTGSRAKFFSRRSDPVITVHPRGDAAQFDGAQKTKSPPKKKKKKSFRNKTSRYEGGHYRKRCYISLEMYKLKRKL